MTRIRNKPKTIIRHQNYIIISWEENNEHILQMYRDMTNEWVTIYKGEKTKIKVDNLAPCSYFNFRFKSGEDNWIEFKSGTCESPLMTMHMTRAVTFAKSPLIRKIAHDKPHLLNTENKNSKTPLVQAIEKNDPSLVTFLVNLGANINHPLQGTNRTPLMIAIYLNRLKIADYLIDKGAKISSVDINGLSVLHYAVDSGKLENLEYILKLGVDVNARDNQGWTPLLRAEQNEEMISKLLEFGGDPEVRDRNGFNFEKHKKLKNV